MADDCELLFFDTFSHESCEELNLDLVQFPEPVYIFEIRVIPLGARVQADFPGGHRLGATNPSSFQLEFFINDLSKKNSSTFERLGSLEYKQNVDIQFPVSNKIPTDGLILRGWYSAVTLAIYGVVSEIIEDRSSPPPPPPPQTASRQSIQEHCQAIEPSAGDTPIPEWERQSRMEVPPEPPPPPVRPHQPVEPQRFEVQQMIHQPPEPHVAYSAEMPPPVIGAFPEPPPPVYQECVPVPQVPAPPVSYGQYDPHYSKPWAMPEEQYQAPADPSYDHQIYSRPQDSNIYQPDAGRSIWDPKDHHGSQEGHEHDAYNRGGLLEHPSMHRDKDMSKDRRDRPWDYKDDDRGRDHDSKRKDRDRRSRETSWERSTVESDRYRDRDRERDRMRDSSNRERERERMRERCSGYMDRGPRKDVREVKRPTTPPSPRKVRPHTPQTPPEIDKIVTGPRTPKEEEPMDVYDEHLEGEAEIHEGENTEEDDGYEEIVSEEEDMSDIEERAIDLSEIDYDLSDESWNVMSSFSPYTSELTTFQHFSDSILFSFEITEKKKSAESNKTFLEEKLNEASKLVENVNEFKDQEHTEKWVELLESINEDSLNTLVYLKSKEQLYEVMDVLIEWLIEGLDFELALKQPQTAYKVRHIKAGITLATLLFQTDSSVISKLLDRDIPKRLLELYNQPYMVLPVKLLIFRAVDTTLSTVPGLNYFVNKTVSFDSPKVFDFNLNEEKSSKDVPSTDSQTCYQKLLEILMSKQFTRAVVSLSSLLNKVHIYEVMLELQDCIEKLIQNNQQSLTKSAPSDSPDAVEPRAPSAELEMEVELASSSENTAQSIVSCLQEIVTAYHNAWKDMAQIKRFLPARSQFEFPKASYSPYPALLRIFKETKLLENIFVVLSSPTLVGHPDVLLAVKDLFLEFLSSQEGMLFLLSSPDAINGILRILLHTVDEGREEGTEENMAQNLGLQIAYHLQALLYVDSLGAYLAKKSSGKAVEESDAISALHDIYTMIFQPFGRPAVIDVLTAAENLNCLLSFVQIPTEGEKDSKRTRSVFVGYVTELLMLVVHYSEDAAILEKFSDALYNLSQQESTPKLHDLSLWMGPTKAIPNYTHEAIGPLMPILKSHVEDACSLPPELITSLRILQYLSLPSNKGSASDESNELKYKYALIQIFTNDGMDNLKGILQNICDTFLKPSHQSPAIVGLQGVLVISIIKPAIFILKALLAHLISSLGTEFKDLTAVPVLLKVFSLMILVPPSAFSYQNAQLVQSEIIEALLTYTQPFLGAAESEEALSKSLWTEMVQEILKYIKLAPSTFVTGLTILSELLPLPLPLQTREPLTEDEVTKMVNYRKLWSAHLHSLSGTIQEVIVSLAATSCHPLQQLLRRVCLQLADLSAPTALFIVKAVLDALLETLILPPPEQKENLDPTVPVTHETSPVLKPPTSTTARILNLIAYLVSQSSFKIPMMHVMRAGAKADEKYLDVLPLMLELFNTPSEKACVIQSQECIVSILQSLCDPDIGFITFESGASVNEVLSCSLPSKEHISLICGALVQHVGCHKHSYSSVLPSLRSLVMLTEHDYGYYHVKQGLDQHPGAIFSLFTRFSLTFSKDSSDCLSTLSTALEFLRLMVNGFEDGAQTGRSILLSPSELAELLRGEPQVKSEKDGSKSFEPFQPVVELGKLLAEFGNDEEAVESLLESISGLLSLLNSAPVKEVKAEKTETTEPVLPAPESQSAQFASRPVFVIGEIEEGRLSPAYWLAIPAADDADQEQEQVPVDLIAIAEKNIPEEFDFKLTLENLCLSTDGENDLKSKKKGLSSVGAKRKYTPLVNPSVADVNNKRPFIAPMRGRGFTRAASHSTRANDPFRSRPPNTSRPPSMHVDDFVALESHHPGNNSQIQNKRPIKDNSRGRGRGFDRNPTFTSTRGTGRQFFSPPGPYGRRESNRGGNRGTTRISNNAWNNRSNQNSNQKLSPGPGQRTNFGNHGRLDSNSPFNQSENRTYGQRNRDPYSELSRASNVVSNRFQRGLRTGGGMNQNNQGHWQDRNKNQNQRFIIPGNQNRGSGRRDMNTRHNRSFTR